MNFSTSLKLYDVNEWKSGSVIKKRKDDIIESNVKLPSRLKKSKIEISAYFICNEGSITHYYHFLFGALIPLLEYHISKKLLSSYKIRTDLGPMKRILCELPLNLVDIAGPNSEDNSEIHAHDDKSLYSSIVLKDSDLLLPSYDIFNSYLYDDNTLPRLSQHTRGKVVDYIIDNMPFYIRTIPTKKILLIERAIEPYYREIKNNLTQIFRTSGSERRVIINHAELAKELENIYGNEFMNLSLERCSLYYQAQMFHSAKIVIAQHGAALANVFFMSPNSHVIEVSPPWSKSLHHFRNLCQFCEVSYDAIDQPADKSVVDIDQILEKVAAITGTWK